MGPTSTRTVEVKHHHFSTRQVWTSLENNEERDVIFIYFPIVPLMLSATMKLEVL